MLRKKYLFISCLLILFYSCEEDTEITFIDTTITTESNTIVEINIPKAIGNAVITESINSEINRHILSVLQTEITDTIGTTKVEDAINRFNNDFNNFKNQFAESAQIWEAQIDGDVMYQSPEIISIAITSYINTGGAHGILKISFLNFNTETGKPITNNMLFNDMYAFEKIAKTNFETFIEDESIDLNTTHFQLPKEIGYTDEGLILLYNTYEIAAYSEGIIEITIPYNEIKSLLFFNSPM